ncbi:S8 family peptidase [Paenibacillus xerothermodurans]|uniref:Peptidase S8 n=1 Tax=Paenibacillus xerothermodurans TaxID=1977292 RepID=A0A2W1NAA0_PAEXE|nr:S8 family peptidase [Paenibacillus xerothermodurans]PZE20101.1 peptidase S8 [Paenibacillus xerothermodurans]
MTLKPSTFVEWLHVSMTGAQRAERKHIIHFSDRHHYEACIRQWNEMRQSLAGRNKIQPLKIINAISCSLSNTDKLSSIPFIKSIESDTKMRVHAVRAANGAQPSDGSIRSGAANIPWGIKRIHAPQAWNKSKGERIRIGVIDTGADYTHPDLRHCLSYGVNLLNRLLMPNDDNGHGTHIAGTIAASSRQHGITGVAPRAMIHPVKAFDHQGSAYVSDIISGIDWCVQNEMQIINMSFGMRTYSKALETAIRNAYHAGVIVVASSGNEGKQATIDYPARLRQVIAVGATTKRGRIAPFSNVSKSIDIYAPGEKIYSTWLRGKYNELSGTSMATSHVTGVVALILSRKAGLSPLHVKSIIKKNAKILPKPGVSIKEVHALRAVGGVAKTASTGR